MSKRLNAGFSLPELLVAVALASVVLAVVMTVFNGITSRFQGEKDRLVAEAVANRAQFMLQQFFSQAIDVQFTGGPADIDLGAGPGLIANGINFSTIASSAPWTTLAVFQREIGSPGPDAGQLSKVGIFYRRPEAGANTPGYIFLTQSTAAGALVPSFNDEFIDRVSLLQITKNRHATFDRVVSLDVRLRIRYNKFPDTGAAWCPQADIIAGTAGCVLNAVHGDIDRSFIILMRNNILRVGGSASLASSGVTSEERTLGNLYFFKMLIPPDRGP